GNGIEEKNLKQIFDPFFTTKPTGKGTGLGLAVCYGIVTAHGGKIEVAAYGNEGTKFVINLPINEKSDET
ncbi:MAG: ATP-binding protein, partial [Acidobacteriota bacterium]|nr:ATP-binding protein [Acidobacteriota bacterium]